MPSPTYWISPTLPTLCTAATVGSPTRLVDGLHAARTATMGQRLLRPLQLDMFRRQWMAQSAAVVSFAKDTQDIFVPDSTCYYPGELYMSAHSTHGSITQRLNFTSASTALLRIEANNAEDLLLSGSLWGKDITVSVEQNSVIARHPSGETVTVTFTPNVELAKTDNNYTALVRSPRYPVNVAISFFTSEKEMTASLQNLPGLLNNPAPALQANAERGKVTSPRYCART